VLEPETADPLEEPAAAEPLEVPDATPEPPAPLVDVPLAAVPVPEMVPL
jgi:hypothetical protein